MTLARRKPYSQCAGHFGSKKQGPRLLLWLNQSYHRMNVKLYTEVRLSCTISQQPISSTTPIRTNIHYKIPSFHKEDTLGRYVLPQFATKRMVNLDADIMFNLFMIIVKRKIIPMTLQYTCIMYSSTGYLFLLSDGGHDCLDVWLHEFELYF